MDVAHLIQTAVAPVFLLSGVGVMLGVLTNRLARIVDRGRRLEERLEENKPAVADLSEQLGILTRRARFINVAITLCAVSALLVALVVMSLFADAALEADFAPAVAVLFVTSMLALTAAFVAFLIEVRLATASLRIGPPR